MTPNIPALSIRQPWAELILLGRKTIELRTWSTNYRGQLWIHTGLQSDPNAEQEFGHLFKGGYVGSVILESVIPLNRDRWQAWQARHLDQGPYQPGVYAWILSNPRRLVTPIPGPGQPGLFYPPQDSVANLREASLH
jgi:hypothetical protein